MLLSRCCVGEVGRVRPATARPRQPSIEHGFSGGSDAAPAACIRRRKRYQQPCSSRWRSGTRPPAYKRTSVPQVGTAGATCVAPHCVAKQAFQMGKALLGYEVGVTSAGLQRDSGLSTACAQTSIVLGVKPR